MLHIKALYNLLRFNVRDDASIPHELWAVEDLRFASLEALFQRLKTEGIILDRPLFLEFAESAETPEELLEILLDEEEDPKRQDRIYLILFELWRRLLPEKVSLSIFCDELDHLIDLYEDKRLESDEAIQDALANLKQILDEHVDAGSDPLDVFAAVEEACAFDLEGFVYDYITDLFEVGNFHYANELIDHFSSFVSQPIWFEILSARGLSFTDREAANRMIAVILKKDLDFNLLVEVLRLLVKSGDRALFAEAVEKAIPHLQTEEEFQGLLQLTADFYRLLDCDDIEKQILSVKQKRHTSPERPLDLNDADLKFFSALILPKSIGVVDASNRKR